MRILFLLFLLSATTLFAQPFPGKIGVGLDGIGRVSLEFPNVVLTSSAWESVANGGASTTDSGGWPTEDFRVVFFDHRPFNAWNNVPDDPQKYVVDVSGTYKLSFAGSANFTSWSDAPVSFQNKVYDTVNNVTTVDIVFPPGGGANQATIGNYGFLMVNFLQTNDGKGGQGVKNIRLTRPGYQHNNPQLYRTTYLNALSPFSCIRFMDFLETNNNDSGYPSVTTWQDRQQPDAPRYTKGAPWERIIALANYTCRDIWINIPVAADSGYVVQVATLMKNTLRPEVNIYIEYSNEVWNGSFTQYQYNYDAVLQSPEDADIRASTPWDDRRRARRVAKQVIKFGKIFEQVMGVTVASGTRIRPVFAWQIGGYLAWYDDVLNWINTTYGAPKNFIYGIAGAPYFNDGGAASNATPQQVVASMSARSDSMVNNIKTVAQYAAQWQIKHMQYEGGPDNGGGSTVNVANRITANRIPEMKTAVLHNYNDNWFSAAAHGTAPLGTNDLINYFVMSGRSSRYGCWGATEDLNYIKDLSKAPKFDALCVLTGMCGNEPVISLSAPANNLQLTVNTTTTISATASDPDGTVKKVEFFAGSVLVGTDSVAPYSVSWTPAQTGIYAVLARAIDNNGKFTFTDANVVEVVSGATGIEIGEKLSILNLYPVPTSGIVTVEFVSAKGETLQCLNVTDVSGRIIYSVLHPGDLFSLNIENFLEGVYFVVADTDTGKKFIKKLVLIKR